MKKSLIIAILASVLAAVVATLEAVPSQPAPVVDLTPAITIGEFTTSRYLFEKALNQFIAAETRRKGQRPGQLELQNWFRLYVAQLVIKADLVLRKQLERTEVAKITEQMARYMLTQPHGPFYREIQGADPTTFRRERRARILKECQFSASPENVAQLWTAIAASLGRGRPPSEADVTPISSSVLASYCFNKAAKQITALDFVRGFQQEIIQLAPHDVKNLENQIEDFVVAEYDCTEAIRRGLDQTPQFLEDRNNFALNQALALYEKEVLSKQLVVSPDEITARYQANLKRYISPVEISGTLRIFPDPETARQAIPAVPSGNNATSGPDKTVDPFVIRREESTALLHIPYAIFVSMPIGQRYGPFPYAGRYAFFVKRTEGESTPMPLVQVEPELQRQLMREKLEALELDYFARNIGRVRVCLDLESYGLLKIEF